MIGVRGYPIYVGFNNIKKSFKIFSIAWLISLVFISLPLYAGGDLETKAPTFIPHIKGSLSIEFQSDYTFKSSNLENEVSDTFNSTYLELGWYFSRYFSIQSGVSFDSVLDEGGDLFFENHGLFIETLYAKFQFNGTKFIAGKYNPAFGLAWDEAPGLYGADFADDYELTERVGFGISKEFDELTVGTIEITASIFQQDRSVLSNSIITERGRTTLANSGVSNTDKPESFTLVVEGYDIPGASELLYNVSYSFQSAGVEDLADEHGYSFGLTGENNIGSIPLKWITEIAYFDNAEGTNDNLTYFTLGGEFNFEELFNLALSYTGRYRDVIDDDDLDDHLFQVSASRKVIDNWDLSIGYKYLKEDDDEDHTIGVLIEKNIEFNTKK